MEMPHVQVSDKLLHLQIQPEVHIVCMINNYTPRIHNYKHLSDAKGKGKLLSICSDKGRRIIIMLHITSLIIYQKFR